MARVLVASGGPTYAHDHGATAVTITSLLTAAGYDVVTTTSHFRQLPDALRADDPDVIVMHALWWRMLADRYADIRDEWAYESTPSVRKALTEFVQNGGGLVALHTATICFDDWPGWGEIVGGQWKWDRSFHPLLGPVRVEVGGVEVGGVEVGGVDVGGVEVGGVVVGDGKTEHEITAGLRAYETVDEVYAHLDLQPGIVPLAYGVHPDGSQHPVLWARDFGSGRVAHFGLGHDSAALTNETTAEILRRCVTWAVRSLEASLPS